MTAFLKNLETILQAFAGKAGAYPSEAPLG